MPSAYAVLECRFNRCLALKGRFSANSKFWVSGHRHSDVSIESKTLQCINGPEKVNCAVSREGVRVTDSFVLTMNFKRNLSRQKAVKAVTYENWWLELKIFFKLCLWLLSCKADAKCCYKLVEDCANSFAECRFFRLFCWSIMCFMSWA